MTHSIPSLPLPPAPKSIPALGLGTWKSPAGVTASIVEAALRKGYRHLDCACDYGNETEVGKGISAAISAGVCKREDIFITSKLWNTYHRPEYVPMAARKTLKDLGVDKLDLYLIHFPIGLKFVPFEERYPPEWLNNGKLVEDPVPVAQTWRAMENLVRDGLVDRIGLSNFPVALIREVLACAEIRPSVLQVELHPYLQQPCLLKFCESQGILVTAFSPLGSGSYSELGMDRGDRVLEEEVFARIGKKVGKSPAQVMLRWGLQRGYVVIPKTSREERLEENMDLFDFELSAEEMKEIATLDKGRRYNDPGVFCVGMGHSIPIYD